MEKIKQQLTAKIKKEMDDLKKVSDNSNRWVTRKEFAKIVGISETCLYNVLKGKASIDSALKVAKVLKIELNVNHDKSHSLPVKK